MTASGALQSYNLLTKLLPGCCFCLVRTWKDCNTMMQEVFEFSGYHRVMVHKFHDDDHVEVVFEMTKPSLAPYFCLHYPATDIPQAECFLFIKNKVRNFCDCRTKHVQVFQDEKLPFDLTFCVVVNDGNEDRESPDFAQAHKRKRLWGLVVSHNTIPRFVAYSLCYACEFPAQVFEIQVNKELELANQILEENILHRQTLLCDNLMRDAPLGIVPQSPNIMDLMKCDGAAQQFRNNINRLGGTPSDFQHHDIVSWL
ncbi:unnamed protein product [Ilex paraguariensis]|uniref:Phytochrome chromophore attachment site domain-containing protein n=1 Tax=Ilex paraguariensis TaxID=185542 RepID=A0ABC8TCL2_9AQUA